MIPLAAVAFPILPAHAPEQRGAGDCANPDECQSDRVARHVAGRFGGEEDVAGDKAAAVAETGLRGWWGKGVSGCSGGGFVVVWDGVGALLARGGFWDKGWGCDLPSWLTRLSVCNARPCCC